jgi:uncharacterized damage-inducible protein DinB
MDEAPWYPPRHGDERKIIVGYLDWYREALLRKVTGLSDPEMKRRLVPSLTTLFGIVHHLAYVERSWFQERFAGRTGLDYPWSDQDPDAEFRVEDTISSEEAIALYERECEISKQIVAEASLDDFARHPKYQDMMLRRIVVHMIEETARHVGHADILRELTDGATGD